MLASSLRNSTVAFDGPDLKQDVQDGRAFILISGSVGVDLARCFAGQRYHGGDARSARRIFQLKRREGVGVAAAGGHRGISIGFDMLNAHVGEDAGAI